VEEAGVPEESHHLRSGRGSRRKPPFKKWKRFQKKYLS
jgi:hypothetical protein